MAANTTTEQALLSTLLASPNFPVWLTPLLIPTTSLPSNPTDVLPHDKPRHPALSAKLAEGMFHPALEACLHLMQGDLYSAHFLVRKAQGGCKYLDWEHAVLHKLEGDFRNAKMWYTDLNKSRSCPAFHEFWPSKSEECVEERVAPVTASQQTDLLAMWSNPLLRAETHYQKTTASADKIMQDGAALTLEQLQQLASIRDSPHPNGLPPLPSAEDTYALTRLELLYMLMRLVQEFGWRAYDVAQSLEAYKEQAMRAPEEEKARAEQESAKRKEQSSSMVLSGEGIRNF